jgi:Putative transcriptional regulator
MTLKTNSDFIFDEKVNNKWNDALIWLGIDASKLSIFSGSC